ncbi:hypothetical protein AAF712_014926 [Marasmius tenuissimus]|uniref:Uncharacterized protein n=1 Tax=Marasmius tenuissimus TaxID=585030 RepID=A0ABR2ZAR7_9AGAR|nr:hypothetical protein PM082_024863 [Marasmius tenuissimus]
MTTPALHGKQFVEEKFAYDVLAPVLVTAIQILLYGAYILLFRIGFRILQRHKREKRKGHRLAQLVLIPLFILAYLVVPINMAWDIPRLKDAYWAISGLEPSTATQISFHTLE